MDRTEANRILAEGTEQKEAPKGISLNTLMGGKSGSGNDTLTIDGRTFNVPAKYLKETGEAYKDVNGGIAVANGVTFGGNLKFDRSHTMNGIQEVKTNEGHTVALKVDTLSRNIAKYTAKAPMGV